MQPTDNFADFTGMFVGQVMELDRKERLAAIYLPKLMPYISNANVRSIKQYTEVGDMVSNINVSKYVTLTNGLWGRPENQNLCLPAVGSRVICFFLENDPKQLFFRPFDVNHDYLDDPDDEAAGYIKQARG